MTWLNYIHVHMSYTHFVQHVTVSQYHHTTAVKLWPNGMTVKVKLQTTIALSKCQD